MFINDYLAEFSLRIGKRKSFAISAALILPVIVFYYYIIIKYSVNFPYLDDYFGLLNFVTAFVKAHGLISKTSLLLAQNNEHRIVFTKAVSLLQLYLCGHLNFKILVLAGNSGLLILFFLLVKEAVFKQHAPVFFAILPAALLFNFIHLENCFWALGSLQNFWVL